MKKNILHHTKIAFLGTFALLASCNSFLEQVPDDRTEIDTPEKIQELITGAYPNGLYMPLAEALSDNASNKSIIAETSIANTWAYHYLDNNDLSIDSPTDYWNNSYAAIAAANHALQAYNALNLGKEYDYLKGEALLCRAYAHFMLGIFWCKPYNETTAATDLGLAYVDEPENVVIKSYSRLSLKDFYDRIEKDIQQGIPLINNSKYKQPGFHFTTQAAHALASKFYLMKADWNKVIEHSNAALGNNAVSKLRDLNTIATKPLAERYDIYSAQTSGNFLIIGAKSRHARAFATHKYGFSAKDSEELFNSNRLRVTWNVGGVTAGGLENYFIPKFRNYSRIEDAISDIGYPYTMATLLTADEVYLNRAEAYLMLGQQEKVVEELNAYFPQKTLFPDTLTVEDINTRYALAQININPNYSATEEQKRWLQCLSDIRRAEFLFEGVRWFDNKRLGMTIVHSSNRGTITLTKDDPRRELQIPSSAISDTFVANPR